MSPVDTGRKLNVHKTTFNLRPVSKAIELNKRMKN